MLAGTDRLDKDLMIGQMQGKFQLVVVPDTGHMIHEVFMLVRLSHIARVDLNLCFLIGQSQ